MPRRVGWTVVAIVLVTQTSVPGGSRTLVEPGSHKARAAIL
jgi:hypothetical protein